MCNAFTLIELSVVSRKPKGFTIVELLVVITIIVVLLALLVPALDRAINQAQALACAGQLHTWGFVVNQYGIDHERSTPYYTAERGGFWFHVLSDYVGKPNYGKGPEPIGGLDEQFGAIICPVVDVHEHQPLIDDANGTAYGFAKRTWGRFRSRGAYGWNNYYSRYPNKAGRPADRFFAKTTKAPGQTPFLGDSMLTDTWPAGSDLPPADVSTGNGASMLGRMAIDRHDMTVNIAFVDGSTRRIELGELWMLDWYKGFEKTAAYRGNYFKKP